MGDTPKVWSGKAEVDGYKAELVKKLQAAAWRRGNPKYKEYRDGMEESDQESDKAYKLLQRGFLSAGQAKILRCAIREAGLKQMKSICEADFLEEMHKLGIEREWKNNDLKETPKLLFHFHLAGGKRETLDMTDAEDLD